MYIRRHLIEKYWYCEGEKGTIEIVHYPPAHITMMDLRDTDQTIPKCIINSIINKQDQVHVLTRIFC